MWCPVCKNEYREGYTHCVDCDVDLVESLDDIRDEEKEEEQFDPALFMSEEEAPEDMPFDEEESGEGDEAQDGFAFIGSGDETDEDIRLSNVYESNRQKAEDYRTSGGALLIVGILGIVAVVLLIAGVLPVPIYGFSKILVSSVMGCLFLIFVVMGISSVKNYKSFLEAAGMEEKLTDSVKQFLTDEITADYVEVKLKDKIAGGSADDFSDEQIYFPRMEVILQALSDRFPELDKSLSEKLADEHYTSLYDSEKDSDTEDET